MGNEISAFRDWRKNGAVKLGAALALALTFHLVLIYGIKVRHARGVASSDSVIEARLEEVKPVAKPVPKAQPVEDRSLIEVSASPPKLAEAVPAKLPMPVDPASTPTAEPAHAQHDSPASRDQSPLPAVDVPLLEDPTYYPAKQVDIHPAPLQPVNPDYPEAASEANVEGEVTLLLLIDELGKVRDISVVETKPEGYDFEDSAIAAFRNARFAPAKRGGRDVKSRFLVRVHFELTDARKKIIPLPASKH